MNNISNKMAASSSSNRTLSTVKIGERETKRSREKKKIGERRREKRERRREKKISGVHTQKRKGRGERKIKGLLNISKEGVIELMSDEAEGLKFKLTDAVDIGPDGTLYFTDASYKYDVQDSVVDIMEGRPHGRLLSYHPSTKQTRVIVKDLYFANGVAVSADHTFVIFCETSMMRCKKYYIQGPQAGSVGMFVENLPGLPDNIRYDGHGLYWIALATESSFIKFIQRYPWIRRVIGIMEKYRRRPNTDRNGGAFCVDLDGKPVAHYYDPKLSLVTSCNKIGDYLYLGSLIKSYITRLDLTRYPATPPS